MLYLRLIMIGQTDEIRSLIGQFDKKPSIQCQALI